MSKRRTNGDGMIRKLSCGTWEGRIVVGHNQNGSSIFRYVYAKTQKELKQKLKKQLDDFKNVNLTEDSNMLLSDWLDIWLEKYMKNTLRANTYRSYNLYVKSYINPYIGERKISSITAKDVQDLYSFLKTEGSIKHKGQGLSDSTIKRIHNVLHKALKMAVENNMLPHNPSDGIRLKKPVSSEMKVLNDEEIQIFIKEVKKDEYWRDFFCIELATGLRLGEICGLKWEDYDESDGKISVIRTVYYESGKISVGEPKTEQGKRQIILPKAAQEILQNRKKISEWIFPYYDKTEEPMHPSSAYRRLKQILKSANLPDIRFHDLRHTFATHALANGVDVKTLSEILGHSKTSFTLDTYTHITDDMKKRASQLVENIMTDAIGKEILLCQNEKKAADF